MFWGSFDHVLDDKGRTSLPKEFRSALDSMEGTPRITLSRACVIILPEERFLALQSHYSGYTDRNESMRRLMLGMSQHLSIDKQGRFSVPQILREKGRLERDLVITGVGDRIEIWDKSLHARELERAQAHYSEYSESGSGGGGSGGDDGG